MKEHTIDRSGWPSGPWDNEPDLVKFTHAGFMCVVARQYTGHLCGYVGLPKTHPLHGVSYSEPSDKLKEALEKRKEQPLGNNPAFAVLTRCVFGGELEATPETVFTVHGGLTYSRDHLLPVGDDANGLWWFGFDCAHCDDETPIRSYGGQYRDIEYVRAETESLADQLASIK